MPAMEENPTPGECPVVGCPNPSWNSALVLCRDHQLDQDAELQGDCW